VLDSLNVRPCVGDRFEGVLDECSSFRTDNAGHFARRGPVDVWRGRVWRKTPLADRFFLFLVYEHFSKGSTLTSTLQHICSKRERVERALADQPCLTPALACCGFTTDRPGSLGWERTRRQTLRSGNAVRGSCSGSRPWTCGEALRWVRYRSVSTSPRRGLGCGEKAIALSPPAGAPI